MSILITFALGYLLGGVTALIILGLAVAARRGDSGRSTPPHSTQQDERVAAPRKHV